MAQSVSLQTFIAVALLSIVVPSCLSLSIWRPANDPLVINTPHLLKQFKDREIGNSSRTVFIEPAADPNVLFQARYFFNRTNDLIRFRDRSHNHMDIHPKNQSVQAVLLNGSHLAHYVPKHYKSYNLTFNASEVNSDANWRDIGEFKNATNLWIGNEFDVSDGYERIVGGLRNLRQLKELTVVVRPHYTTSQFKAFLELPPVITKVRVVLPWGSDSEQVTRSLARNQYLPRGWNSVVTSNGAIHFDKSFQQW